MSQKLTKLQIADEIYKFVFMMKLQRFKEKFPNLSPEEVLRKTREYFRDLPKTP